MIPYFIIIGKSIIIYLFIIGSIRLFGKKELSQLSIIDLVFILLISNSVQNAMVGNDTSLLGGILACSGLFLVNFLFRKLLKENKNINKLIQGESIIIVHEGKIIKKGLESSGFTKEEIEMAIREHGQTS